MMTVDDILRVRATPASSPCARIETVAQAVLVMEAREHLIRRRHRRVRNRGRR